MPNLRTHYELLGIDPSADESAIRAAFRQQIARYHPDKVIHLGREFQELAEQRTTDLTLAYKTLIDAARRREYDLSSRTTTARFDQERSGGHDIVHRAVIARVRAVMTDLYGAVHSPWVRGFDLTLVPTVSPPLLRSPFPRVFVRLLPVVNVAQVSEACVDAVRAGLHVPRSPLNVLLFGQRIEDEAALADTCTRLRSQRHDIPDKTFVVVFDASDWRAMLPNQSPPALVSFITRLRS